MALRDICSSDGRSNQMLQPRIRHRKPTLITVSFHIPKGRWHLGGAVSSHKPVMVDLSLPEPNGVALGHGHVLNNGMVSAD